MIRSIYHSFGILALVGGLVAPMAPAFALTKSGSGAIPIQEELGSDVAPIGIQAPLEENQEAVTSDNGSVDVITQAADFISANSAVLHMNVTAARVIGDVQVWFELSTDAANLDKYPVGFQKLYTNGEKVPVASIVDNLTPNTTYYFRGHAQVVGGATDVDGNILSFKTAAISIPPVSGTSQPANQDILLGTDQPAGWNTNLPWVRTQPASLIGANSAALYLVVNPNRKNVAVWFDWGTSQSALSNKAGYIEFNKQQANGLGWATFLGGFSPNTTYYFRAVAKNDSGTVYGGVLSFKTLGPNPGIGIGVTSPAEEKRSIFDIFRPRPKVPAPQIVTQPAGLITDNTAVLYAIINPNHQNVEVWFEWGPAGNSDKEDFGNKAGYIKFNKEQANGLPWGAIIQGLNPNSRYVFRAWVKGENGNASPGETLSFATTGTQPNQPPAQGQSGSVSGGSAAGGSSVRKDLPGVSTQPAGLVTANTAVLYAVLNPNQTDIEAWFEWGPTESLGTKAGYIKFNKQQANGLPWAAIVDNLQPNTTYYFRAIVRNSAGTVKGDLMSFKTEGPKPASQAPGFGRRVIDFFRGIFGGR